MFQKIKSFLFENKTAKQTVAKNTFWLTVSNFGGRLLKAIIIIYGARVLGTAGWGVFSYAVTLAGFLTLFMDPGMNAILMRDAARSEDTHRRALFSTTFVMKLFLLALGVSVVIFIAPYFSTLPGAKALLPVVALILAFDTAREFFSSFIRSMEKMEWEAGIFLLTNAAIVVFGFIFLSLVTNAKSFGWGYVAGTAIGAGTAMFILRRYFKDLFSHFSSALILPILRSAWPFAITGALGLLLTNTDILIISWLRSASDVGVYSSAIRIVQLFYLVPMILQFSTLPLLSRLANKDNERFRSMFERTISLVFLVSIPLALGGTVLGTQIMELLFGTAYATGGLSFKILMLTMLVDFPMTIISAAIFAYDRQKSLITAAAIGGISNVVFDLLFIPPFGIAGSAVATLLAQALSNWYLWHMMRKINRFEILSRLKMIVPAGVIMGAATVALLVVHANVIVNVAISAAIYFLILRISREPLLVEIKRLLFPPAVAAVNDRVL